MTNMSYCRFENTYADFTDCINALQMDDVSSLNEWKYAQRMIECAKVYLEYEDFINDCIESMTDRVKSAEIEGYKSDENGELNYVFCRIYEYLKNDLENYLSHPEDFCESSDDRTTYNASARAQKDVIQMVQDAEKTEDGYSDLLEKIDEKIKKYDELRMRSDCTSRQYDEYYGYSIGYEEYKTAILKIYKGDEE